MALLNKRTFIIGCAILLIASAVFILVRTLDNSEPDWITAQVEKGDVAEVVSVSGFIEAKNTAELAFPSSGVVTEVFANEGQAVTQGELLATLGSAQLAAARTEAEASLQAAQARLQNLLSGAAPSYRDVADTSLTNAHEALQRTIGLEEEKATQAHRTLLSDGLEAISSSADEPATAPAVSGTYLCQDEGVYTIEVYSSGALSGYSYRYDGLQKGVGTVSTDQPSPLGSCGLYLQFTDGDTYGASTWTIDIPNTRSSTYVANKNAYDLAVKQRTTNVAAAQDALALAQKENADVNAAPTDSEVTEAQAAVGQAQAAIEQVDAQLRDRSIVAPFDGIITEISILKGETAFAEPVITLLASNAFELKARVPEIDITKIVEGQPVEAVFDAQTNETYTGKVSYLSPLATLIDGVAYFEATIALDTIPTWIRSGLNADVDITVTKKENVLRIPQRFLIEDGDGSYSVKTRRGNTSATTSIEILFTGNDGYIEISGLKEGDTVIAP